MAVKTAFLVDALTNPVVPRGFAYSLRDRRMPPEGTVVWPSASSDTTNAAVATKRAYRFPDRGGHRSPDANAYAITFTAFRVLFQVFGHFTSGAATMNDQRHGLKPALDQLWPVQREVVSWPPPRLMFRYA